MFTAATKTAKDRYTEEQWQKLHEYWEHPLFQKTRPLGYFICIAAIIIAMPPLLSTNWVTLQVHKPVNYTYSKCIYTVYSHSKCIYTVYSHSKCIYTIHTHTKCTCLFNRTKETIYFAKLVVLTQMIVNRKIRLSISNSLNSAYNEHKHKFGIYGDVT